MSIIEPSSPRGTGNEGAASTSFMPPQMEVPQGLEGEAQSQLGVECPLILDLMLKFQQMSLDEPKQLPIPEDLNSQPTEDVAAEVARGERVAEATLEGEKVPEEVAPEVVPQVVPQVPLGPVRDGNYFLKLVREEQARLLAQAQIADNFSAALAADNSISEDVMGILRLASGSARLLVKSKMNQFENLCVKNLNPSPAERFPTTIDDLEGFWDMVYIQVMQLDATFADIEHLKANNWQRAPEPSTTTTKSKAKKARPASSKASPAPLTTDEKKTRTMERRMALVKARQAPTNNTNNTSR